jgi:rhamnosyl/mannosyltransferase
MTGQNVWQVMVVGSGPLEAELRRRTRGRGLEKQISWLGECSDDEVVHLMQRCHALLLPSVDEAEAYCIVQVEAMACGKPVISTNLKSGVPFVNAHGVSGLVAPPRDALAFKQAMDQLWSDAELYQKLAQGARQRAHEEFSEDAMIRKMGEFLMHTASSGVK